MFAGQPGYQQPPNVGFQMPPPNVGFQMPGPQAGFSNPGYPYADPQQPPAFYPPPPQQQVLKTKTQIALNFI